MATPDYISIPEEFGKILTEFKSEIMGKTVMDGLGYFFDGYIPDYVLKPVDELTNNESMQRLIWKVFTFVCVPHDPEKPAMKANRDGISRSLRFKVLERDGYKCRYCGRSAEEVELEIDHVIPVSKGGKTEIDNLVTACFDCNRGKRDKIVKDPRE